MATYLTGGTVYTMNAERRVLDGASVVFDGDTIQSVGPPQSLKPGPGDDVVDLQGKWLLPGFVNSHVHVVQQLARGLADDVDILTWLHKRIWPYESSLSAEEAELSTLMAGIEQIRNGVTSICDAGIHDAPATVRALETLGLRATLCFSIMDSGDGLPEAWQLTAGEAIAKQEAAFETYHNTLNGRLRWAFGLRTLMNHTDELVEQTRDAANERQAMVHMHVAEGLAEDQIIRASRGTTTIRHLEKLGLLNERFLAAHAQGVDAEEIDLFARRGVKVSYNPSAALRVMGFSPIYEMAERGVCLGIATDGVPSNGRNSLMDEVFFAGHVQRGRRADQSGQPEVALPVTRLLEMVTCEGARCLGLDATVGSIEPGKKADLVIVDPMTPAMVPVHDPIANLVYSLKTENIHSTLCDGRWLMRDRRLVCLDEAELVEKAAATASAIRQRTGIELPPRYPVEVLAPPSA